MIVKLLTEHHLGFLSLIGGCRGSSESRLIKMSNCWKSHAAAHRIHMALTPFLSPEDEYDTFFKLMFYILLNVLFGSFLGFTLY